MSTVDVTRENLENLVTQNPMVVIDFWAPWCGPCRSFAPVYEATSDKHPEIVFAKLNTEEQQDLAAHFQIRAIPTLMIFKEQIIIYAESGALPGQALERLVTEAKALDMDQVRREIAESQQKQ